MGGRTVGVESFKGGGGEDQIAEGMGGLVGFAMMASCLHYYSYSYSLP